MAQRHQALLLVLLVLSFLATTWARSLMMEASEEEADDEEPEVEEVPRGSSSHCPPPRLRGGGRDGLSKEEKAIYAGTKEVQFISAQMDAESGLWTRKLCRMFCREGKWSEPKCLIRPTNETGFPVEGVYCPLPPPPSANVIFTVRGKPLWRVRDSLFQDGEVVYARCSQPGMYLFLGSNRLMCTDGSWKGETPKCIPSNKALEFSEVRSPPAISFHIATGKYAISPDGVLWVLPNSAVHLDCIYFRVNGTPTWRVHAPLVGPGENVDDEGGVMVTKIKVWRDFPVGWSVDENEREWIYRLSIFDAREEDSGVFSCTSPDHMTNSLQLEVQAVSCPSVVLSDPLLRIVSAGDSTLMNARLDFTCSPGFQLQGPPSIRCLHTGNWSSSLPKCRRVRCPPLELPPIAPRLVAENTTIPAVLQRYSDTFGGRALFECPPGYRLLGTPAVECTKKGFWSQMAPICEVLRCTRPFPPAFGSVTLFSSEGQELSPTESPRVGDWATFACSEGHAVMGSPRSQCAENGRWDYPQPTCRIGCSYPLRPLRGGVFSPIKDFYWPGDFVLVTCDPGLSPPSPKRDKLFCDAEGEGGGWIGNAASACVPTAEVDKDSSVDT